jgi:DNA ligase-1
MNLMGAHKAPHDLSTLQYPLLISPKLDGIRATALGGRLWSKTGKLIPNRNAQSWAQRNAEILEGLDGELVCHNLTATMGDVSSLITSHDRTDPFTFMVFDIATPEFEFLAYTERRQVFHERIGRYQLDAGIRLHAIPNVDVNSALELLLVHETWCSEGYEGTMIRVPSSRYIRKKSKMLLKLKGWDDEEATVLGVLEEKDKHGALKGTLGKIQCVFDDGAEFRCGSGFSADQRVEFWDDPSLIIGKRVTIKYQPAPGGRPVGDAPRFPIFKGLRPECDL